MSEQDWMDKDFYQILGVPKDSDKSTIRKAYRKLARSYHPDQNPGDKQAEERFKEVGEAYAVLSDERQRKQYDAIRAMAGGGARFSAGPGGPGGGGFEDVFASMFSGGHGGPGRAGPQVQFTSNAGGAGDLGDLLAGMFGGAGSPAAGPSFGGPGPGHPGFSPQRRQGSDLAAAASLSLRQAVEGATLRLKVEGQSLTVRVPAGVRDGQKVRLRGKGRPGVNGGLAGDLVVTVMVKPNPIVHMDGRNLRLKVPVTFAEAALGATVEVPLLDGGVVSVKVPAGTSSGAILRVRGRGVKATKAAPAGDLLVEVVITIPKDLDEAARAAVESWSQAVTLDNPRKNLAEQIQGT